MIQCQGYTCAGWLWEGEGGLGDHQPGVYVPLKALFLLSFVLCYIRVPGLMFLQCSILVASKCESMGMKVLGITRSVPSEDNRCPAVSEYR